MHRSGKIILRESDGPHIKDDEKSENNMMEKMCVKWRYDDTIYEMMIYVYTIKKCVRDDDIYDI